MITRSRLVATCAVALLGGCADFGAVSAFATRTTGMTATVRTELSAINGLCTEQAVMLIVVNDRQDEQPLADCETIGKVQGRLAVITVDVLDAYARTLLALADDRSFDLSPDVRGVAAKLQSLRGADGKPVVETSEATAITRVADLLADVVTSLKREEAVKRMVEATPDLMVTGDVLKSFFVRTVTSTAKAPYSNLVDTIAASIKSTEVTLGTPAMRAAEPIRTAELLRQERSLQAFVARRGGTTVDAVPLQIGTTIDAWQDALRIFSTDALKPDPKALLERLQTLKAKTEAARAAILAQ